MKQYLAIDIGGTAVKLGIVDETGAVGPKAEESVNFDGYQTPVLTTVLKAAKAFVETQNIDVNTLEGVGVSATGQIDSRKGIVAGTCGNFPNYINSPIQAELERLFGLPVTVANDANCMTLGEVWVGGAKGYTDVIGVTLGTGVGGGILTEFALQLRDEGLSAPEIAARLNEEKQHIVTVALVDTLEYLKRGGRISKSLAFAGTMLQIKPVLAVTDGEIQLLGKARGSKMGNNLLAQEIQKAGGVDFSRPVLLGYTGLSDALLQKYIEDSRWLWADHAETLRYTTIGSVIGTHAGPGAFGLAFLDEGFTF